MVGKKKSKREIVAVNQVNLAIQEGEIFGLLGPNGAGKTTLIKMISTLLFPTEGNIYVNGYDIYKDEKEIKCTIGVLLANNRSLYLKLTAKENLEFFCNLYNVPRSEQEARIDEVLTMVGLLDRKNDYVETFSHGMLQRLNIARAMIHKPKFLILDEPTNGLDPVAANELRNTIIRLNNQGLTILLTTHNMMEADMLSNRVAIIHQGKIISEGSPEQLKKSINKNIYEVKVKRTEIEKATEILKEIGIEKVNIISGDHLDQLSIRMLSDKAYNLEEMNRIFNNKGLEVYGLSLHNPTLEDVFINLTGKAL
ncbi:hypothetical protein BBF96_09460 [Anoxybacter fermentans]|uniref:ABC transporter domain-containing protein n=1 Tax=Anoxybacter fermentans TaxID=1323375 RepID=A0A3S9T2V9_9FIRM|nr:hypothetical protein BBF96_09460 [Anoxybacter fermentans]